MEMTGRCRFGLYEFDSRTGELRREGEIVKLSPQPARVLALLLAKAGEVVLRDELRAHLWGDETFVDFERGLNFCVLQVRSALGDSSENPRFIQTVPRKGYRFIAPVSAAPPSHGPPSVLGTSVPASDLRPAQEPPSRLAGSPAPAVFSRFGEVSPALARAWRASEVGEVSSVDGGPWDGRRSLAGTEVRSRARATYTVLAIGALVVLAPVIWLLTVSARPVADPAATRTRIAILPFVNLTGDSADDYIVDGVTDELIAQLGRASPERLGVIARTSVMRYRNTTKSVAEIGRELDVRYVIEGSVRREGTRTRITMELVDVKDEAQVWSDAFERSAAESIDLQTAAAVRVARAVTLELVPGAAGPPLPRPTPNADAWDAYLRGRYWLNRGGAGDVRQSLDQFETAVRLDPKFAVGWAQLAEARHAMVMIGAMAPRDAYPRAQQGAARALALDTTLADAHVAAGIVQLWYDWQPAKAARSFERALAINPSHAAAHHDYAWSLVGLGRFDDAVAHITMARDLDPLSPRANTDIGWLYLHLRQPGEAARACRHMLAIQSDALEPQACLERAFMQQGMYDEALRAAQSSLPSKESLVLPATGSSADIIHAIWRWRLRRLEEAAKTRWVSPYSMAVHLLVLGEPDRAIEQLEEAYERRVGALAFVRTDPALDPVRSHPRFDALVTNVTQGSR
jgi:TolB-like protein/DNA-binding winged helix-turn-helix (wHTH) protein/Tfp pilus assembly protein PilF